jgi:4-hydroxy-tetrahydrodipicolinate reductase
MSTKKLGKPAVKAASKPAPKSGAKALQKKPIDLKSPEKPGAKPAAKAAPAAAPAPGPAASAPRPPAPAAKPAPRPVVSAPAAKTKRPSNGAVKVGVVGCAGRMGQMLLRMLINAPGIVVVGGTERRGSIALGQDIGALAGADPLGISVGDDPSLLFDTSDVVVDFTNPTATVQHAQMAARTGCALVIGTTGFDGDQLNSLYRAAQRAPIVLAANMSLGINLLQQVVEEVARILDPDWDIEIVEMHHRAKIDAPSGTALALGEAAARGRGQQLRRISRRSRDGQVGPRVKGEIGFAALRGGDVVGDHTVIFAADGERVEITHRAASREIFARGAVKSVLWAAGKKPGLYSMRDVLGFSVQGPSSTPPASSQV